MKKSILILIITCGFLFIGCKGGTTRQHVRPAGPPKSDVDFAKDVFQMMGDGNTDVIDMLDWENLKMVGVDIGEQYRAASGDSAREAFQESFLRGYSNSFKSSGGNAAAMKNWREQSKDPSNTVVAGDVPNGQTLLITVTHTNGQQYVSSLQIK